MDKKQIEQMEEKNKKRNPQLQKQVSNMDNLIQALYVNTNSINLSLLYRKKLLHTALLC